MVEIPGSVRSAHDSRALLDLLTWVSELWRRMSQWDVAKFVREPWRRLPRSWFTHPCPNLISERYLMVGQGVGGTITLRSKARAPAARSSGRGTGQRERALLTAGLGCAELHKEQQLCPWLKISEWGAPRCVWDEGY